MEKTEVWIATGHSLSSTTFLNLFVYNTKLNTIKTNNIQIWLYNPLPGSKKDKLNYQSIRINHLRIRHTITLWLKMIHPYINYEQYTVSHF